MIKLFLSLEKYNVQIQKVCSPKPPINDLSSAIFVLFHIVLFEVGGGVGELLSEEKQTNILFQHTLSSVLPGNKLGELWTVRSNGDLKHTLLPESYF